MHINCFNNNNNKKLCNHDFFLKIMEEVMSHISRCLNVTTSDIIEIYVLEIEKKVLLSLGQLDFDTSVKEFNESTVDIYTRFGIFDLICIIVEYLKESKFYHININTKSS